MKVLTDNPIIFENKESSNFGGGKERRSKRRTERKGKDLLDKSKGGINKAQEGLNKAQNLINSLGGILGANSNEQDRGADVQYVEPTKENKSLSKGAKIGIAIGGVTVVGLIIFLIIRSKNK